MEQLCLTDLASGDEEHLVEAARLDPQALGALYQLYRPRVYRYLQVWIGDAEEADDLAQDVFLRAMSALPGYRPNGAPFLAWLMRIARNRALDRLRAARRRTLLSLEAQAESGFLEVLDPATRNSNSLPVEEIARVELRQRLLTALEQLPEGQRVAVILVDIEGLTYDEAAAMAAVPAGTLKSRLSRGRARLRALLLADERSRELIEMVGVREGQQGGGSLASSCLARRRRRGAGRGGTERSRRDPEAFGVFYQRYLPQIYRYLRARAGNTDDAADLTQQVFLKALAALPGYRPCGRPFLAWLLRIARNAVADFYRRQPPTVAFDLLPQVAWGVGEESPESIVLRREELARLQELYLRLDPAKQELLALRFAAGLTVPEIAAVIGKREAAVRKQFQRVVHQLKEQFRDA